MSTLQPLTIVYSTFGGGKLGVALFPGGSIFVSGYGCTKATYRGLVTYWAATPAVVGVTKTAFGLVCAAGLLPTSGDLNTIGNAALGTTYINMLLAADYAYFPPYVS